MTNVTGKPASAAPASLVEALLRHAGDAPHMPAYMDSLGTLDYGTLSTVARRAAAWLHAQGVRAGDKVALAMDYSATGARRALELFYGCSWLGAAVLPLYPDVPQKARIDLVARFKVTWLLAAGAPAQVAGARALDPLLFDSSEIALDQHPAPRGDGRDAPCLYNFTSGTTGTAKVLLACHGDLLEKNRFANEVVNLAAGERVIAPAPWPSVIALRYLLRAHLAGAAFVSAPLGETRTEFAANLRRHGVTRVHASPWQVRRLLLTPAADEPLVPLRNFSVLGAMIEAQEIAAARAAFTPNLVVDYGTNETGPLAVLAAGELPLDRGHVGRLLPGVQVRVDSADNADTRQPGAGETGRIGFRTPWMNAGYVDSPRADAAHFRDGWFYPGDAGCVDAQGEVFLRGRLEEVINYGGLKIWPADLEAVIRQHPAVLDCVVAALPHPLSGEVPAAFVTARPAVYLRLEEQQLREFCAARLDAGRVPQLFFIVASIPRNANGKVLRAELLARYPYAAAMALAL
jgi:acyl-CoA synthetase (AMP-forming)/AMP-acid ligase II